mgnify:CR=1 FL=1
MVLALQPASFLPEGDLKTLSTNPIQPFPDKRTTAIPPIPAGVDIAAIIQSYYYFRYKASTLTITQVLRVNKTDYLFFTSFRYLLI